MLHSVSLLDIRAQYIQCDLSFDTCRLSEASSSDASILLVEGSGIPKSVAWDGIPAQHVPAAIQQNGGNCQEGAICDVHGGSNGSRGICKRCKKEDCRKKLNGARGTRVAI